MSDTNQTSRRDMLWLTLAGLTTSVVAGRNAWAHAEEVPATRAAGEQRAADGRPASQRFLDQKLPPSRYAQQMFDKILAKADYQGTPVLFLSSFGQDCQNAYATCLPTDAAAGAGVPMPPMPGGTPGMPHTPFIPVIVYNPAFMSQIAFATNNEYVPAYVLAHELGHIVCRHVDPNNPAARLEHPWKHELEADEFAGKVIARMRALPSDLELAHRVMVANQWLRYDVVDKKVRVVMADRTMRVRDLISGSSTHPDAIQRIQAIARGYHAGGGQGEIETNLRRIFTRVIEEAIRWDPEG